MSTTIYLLPIERAREKDEAYYARYFPQRLETAKRFLHEEDRLRCLGGSLLLREVLGLDEAQITILRGGKPEAGAVGVNFNLSHSGAYTVLAVSDRSVGVDIELCSLRHISVAKAVYTEAEIQWMNENQEERFTLLWTAKEAVSKALGLGLGLKFTDFEVLGLLRGECLQLRGEELYGRALPCPGYSLSVCTLGDSGEIGIEYL